MLSAVPVTVKVLPDDVICATGISASPVEVDAEIVPVVPEALSPLEMV